MALLGVYSVLMRGIEEWDKEALCRSDYSQQLRLDYRPRVAKRYCNTICPVVTECLHYAIIHDEEGVWGGTTTEERKEVSVLLKAQLIAEARLKNLIEYRLTTEAYLGLLHQARQSNTPELSPVDLTQAVSELEELVEELNTL